MLRASHDERHVSRDVAFFRARRAALRHCIPLPCKIEIACCRAIHAHARCLRFRRDAACAVDADIHLLMRA